MKAKPEIKKFEVKIDFPWSLHEKGDIITVYADSCRAYIVQCDYECCGSEKYDLRDFPEIFEELKIK